MNVKEYLEENSMPISETGCWIWLGAHIGPRSKYGRCRKIHGSRSAHRVSYITYKGDIPEGLMVLHKCDIAPCINPAHLYLGTPADNAADMKGKKALTIEIGEDYIFKPVIKFPPQLSDIAYKERKKENYLDPNYCRNKWK